MQLLLYRIRFHFRALESIHFPAYKSANILRGAFGEIFRRVACHPACSEPACCPRAGACIYERIFAPIDRRAPGSRFRDLPRPMVFRAAHLDGHTLPEGAPFHFDVHTFDGEADTVACLCIAFHALAAHGLGPRRGRAQLRSAVLTGLQGEEQCVLFPPRDGAALPPPLLLRLDDKIPLCERDAEDGLAATATLRVRLLTPTEIKHGGEIVAEPPAEVLIGRAFDRLESLAQGAAQGRLQGAEAAPQAEPAGRVRAALMRAARKLRLASAELRHVDALRESSRTGRSHPLGGFIGELRYEGPGPAAEALRPWLRAAHYTGIGRQTVWGKGQIEVLP